MFIDSHCHLEGPKYEADREQVLARAAEAGIEAVLAMGNGTGPESLDCGIKVAEEFDRVSPDLVGSTAKEYSHPLAAPEGWGTEYPAPVNPHLPKAGRCGAPGRGTQSFAIPRIFASVGIHPHEAQVAEDAVLAELERLAQHPKVIAWGEIGLDYWYNFSPREVQRAVFVRQMELARTARKPIIIHCRNSKESSEGRSGMGGGSGIEDAWDDLLRLARLNWAGTGLGGILHCFSGSREQMLAGLDLGFMISFAGNITFPKAEEIRTAARDVPLDRMLIETDSPYLAPVPHRGRRNEPAYVKEVAQAIGHLRQMSPEAVGAATSANFYRFFGLESHGQKPKGGDSRIC